MEGQCDGNSAVDAVEVLVCDSMVVMLGVHVADNDSADVTELEGDSD